MKLVAPPRSSAAIARVLGFAFLSSLASMALAAQYVQNSTFTTPGLTDTQYTHGAEDWLGKGTSTAAWKASYVDYYKYATGSYLIDLTSGSGSGYIKQQLANPKGVFKITVQVRGMVAGKADSVSIYADNKLVETVTPTTNALTTIERSIPLDANAEIKLQGTQAEPADIYGVTVYSVKVEDLAFDLRSTLLATNANGTQLRGTFSIAGHPGGSRSAALNFYGSNPDTNEDGFADAGAVRLNNSDITTTFTGNGTQTAVTNLSKPISSGQRVWMMADTLNLWAEINEVNNRFSSRLIYVEPPYDIWGWTHTADAQYLTSLGGPMGVNLSDQVSPHLVAQGLAVGTTPVNARFIGMAMKGTTVYMLVNALNASGDTTTTYRIYSLDARQANNDTTLVDIGGKTYKKVTLVGSFTDTRNTGDNTYGPQFGLGAGADGKLYYFSRLSNGRHSLRRYNVSTDKVETLGSTTETNIEGMNDLAQVPGSTDWVFIANHGGKKTLYKLNGSSLSKTSYAKITDWNTLSGWANFAPPAAIGGGLLNGLAINKTTKRVYLSFGNATANAQMAEYEFGGAYVGTKPSTLITIGRDLASSPN